MTERKSPLKSSLLSIDGKDNSLVIDLLTREVLLIPNSQKEDYCHLHNKTAAIYDNYVLQTSSLEVISSWLFLTFSCDLACTYCFENKMTEEIDNFMSPETIDSICRQLNKMKDSSTRRFELVYFGGEPLLNYPGMIYAVHKFNNELEGQVSHKLITNGVALSIERARELITLGVSVIQITLDGNEIIHNTRRPTLRGGGSYKTILENIKNLLSFEKIFTLIIRINIDRNNSNSILSLLEEEIDVFADPRVFIDVGKVCSHTFCSEYPAVMSRNEFSLFYEHIITKIYKMNLQAVPPFSGGCSRNKNSASFFSPQGKLFRCPAIVSDKTAFYEDSRTPSSLSVADRCKTCELLLFCGGGCNLNGAYSKEPSCAYEYIYKDLISYYKTKYHKQLDYSLSDGETENP